MATVAAHKRRAGGDAGRRAAGVGEPYDGGAQPEALLPPNLRQKFCVEAPQETWTPPYQSQGEPWTQPAAGEEDINGLGKGGNGNRKCKGKGKGK